MTCSGSHPQSGLVEEMLQDTFLLQKSTHSLTHSGAELAEPPSPRDATCGTTVLAPPHGDGSKAFAESHSFKGKWTSPAPSISTQQRRKELPSHTQLEGRGDDSSGNEVPGKAAPAQRPPVQSSRQQARGFFGSLRSRIPPC